MPFGGNDWLALTSEPTLEPELPICDPHHHFWDRRSARIPYQRYLLDELAADIQSGHNVRSTVFIECRSMYRKDGPEEMRPVGEVEFVQGQAAASASGLYGPAPRRRGHHRARQSEPRRAGRAGAGSVAGGESQSVSRHPAFGDVGSASRGGKHRRAQERRASSRAISFAPARGCWRAWDSRWRDGVTTRNSRSWLLLPRRCPS